MKVWAAIVAVVCAALLSGFTPWLRASTVISGGISASYVQGITQQNGVTSSTTVVATLTNPVGTNNAVFVTIGYSSGGGDIVTGVTDNKGNTYTIVDTVQDTTDGYAFVSAYAVGVSGGPTIITATISNTRQFASMVVDEFSGIPPTVILDGHSANTQQALSAGTDAVTSGAATLTGGDFVYGSTVNVASAGSESPGTGFVSAQHTPSVFLSEYKSGVAVGSNAATFTSTATTAWITYMLALR